MVAVNVLTSCRHISRLGPENKLDTRQTAAVAVWAVSDCNPLNLWMQVFWCHRIGLTLVAITRRRKQPILYQPVRDVVSRGAPQHLAVHDVFGHDRQLHVVQVRDRRRRVCQLQRHGVLPDAGQPPVQRRGAVPRCRHQECHTDKDQRRHIASLLSVRERGGSDWLELHWRRVCRRKCHWAMLEGERCQTCRSQKVDKVPRGSQMNMTSHICLMSRDRLYDVVV